MEFKYEKYSDTNFQTSFEYHKNITEPSVLYYNKDFFYKKGYDIQVINKDTQEDLVKGGKVTLDKETPNYINIKCLEDKMEDNTNVTIIFKSL